MNTTRIGQLAEQSAAEYLCQQGYEITARNWKTRYCEIDIIARKTDVVHFIEVKYRHNARQGTGLDYITTTKLRRMNFAAAVWCRQQRWFGDVNIAAIEVSGTSYEVCTFIESVTVS